MSKFTVPGFPDEISNEFFMPDVGELLFMPMFAACPIEDFMKQAHPWQKWVVEQIPFRNDHKYITVVMWPCLLEPNIRTHVRHVYKDSWHIDGATNFDYRIQDERVFLAVNDVDAVTEFNTTPLEIDFPEDLPNTDFIPWMNDHADELGIKGKKMEPFRWHTFYNHIHRAVEPERLEIRYLMRVRETNDEREPQQRQPIGQSLYFNLATDSSVPSVVHTPEGVLIRPPLILQKQQLEKKLADEEEERKRRDERIQQKLEQERKG